MTCWRLSIFFTRGETSSALNFSAHTCIERLKDKLFVSLLLAELGNNSLGTTTYSYEPKTKTIIATSLEIAVIIF